jgi:hypothetical protein
MTESEEWHAMRKRYEAFMATDLGKLYRAYDSALVAYWKHDADEDFSPAKRKDLAQAARETTNAFVAKLMEVAGVP